MFNRRSVVIVFCSFLFIFSSCTVTNNFYVNSAIPAQKGNPDIYAGISNGYKPKADSGQYSSSYLIALGAQIAIPKMENTNVRFAIHVPELFSGFGSRLGIQQSFFKRSSDFNIAVGTDMGFTISPDSTRGLIDGLKHAVKNEISSTINLDFFVPVTFRLSEYSQFTITPRYSYTKVYVRDYDDNPNKKNHKVYYPALTLGYKYKHVYVESSVMQFQNKLVPFFGIGFIGRGLDKASK